jgi:P-type E1-E2 ATPase
VKEMRTIDVPGAGSIQLAHLILDVNGTLTDRGTLIPGVADRLNRLAERLALHLLTADTFGTADRLATDLGLTVTPITNGQQKADLVESLGAGATAAVGNGRNDEAMLRAARLGIAVIGPEGAATATLVAADVVCRSVLDALDLLLDERALAATLRP